MQLHNFFTCSALYIQNKSKMSSQSTPSKEATLMEVSSMEGSSTFYSINDSGIVLYLITNCWNAPQSNVIRLSDLLLHHNKFQNSQFTKIDALFPIRDWASNNSKSIEEVALSDKIANQFIDPETEFYGVWWNVYYSKLIKLFGLLGHSVYPKLKCKAQGDFYFIRWWLYFNFIISSTYYFYDFW